MTREVHTEFQENGSKLLDDVEGIYMDMMISEANFPYKMKIC